MEKQKEEKDLKESKEKEMKKAKGKNGAATGKETEENKEKDGQEETVGQIEEEVQKDEAGEKIAELEEKIAKGKDDYLRLMAEFDNFRRRTAQEKLELVSSAAADTIKGLLPVLDDFERAMKALKDSQDSNAAKEGTELIYNKLMGYLKTKGLETIEALDKEFDTDLHEAVAQFPVEDADKKGKVYDVVQTGYTLNGKVIRFAKVVVAI